MAIELNRATFRRLVQLYSLVIALGFAAIIYEGVAPGWRSFSDEFSLLVDRHFGVVSDSMMIIAGSMLLVGLIWHIISIVWVLRFRNWARLSFWLSILLITPIGTLPGLNGPAYFGILSNMTTCLGSALLGIILLLAYSADHGNRWFSSEARSSSEET